MYIFENFSVYIIITLFILLIWEQARIIRLKRKMKALEKYITKYNISRDDDAVK